MTFVITQRCVDEVYANCLGVCPVDCIHYVAGLPEGQADAGKPFMVIDPGVCIECGACAVMCPIGAIGHADDELVRSDYGSWVGVNARLARLSKGARPPLLRPSGDPPRRPDNRLIEY